MTNSHRSAASGKAEISPMELASKWALILEDASAEKDGLVVAIRVASGDLYEGRVIGVGTSMVDLEQRNADTGKIYDHTIALTAIIALTMERSP